MWNIVGNIVGGAIGKTIAKIIERIPSKAESRRNQLTKLRREYEELLTKKQTPAGDKRIAYIMRRVRELEGSAVNQDS